MIYVQAVDGMFYKNPVLFGSDWYLRFDVEYAPEIVIRKFGHSTPESLETRARRVLKQAGVQFNRLVMCDIRVNERFPPNWKAYPATSFFMDVIAPIPVPESYESRVSAPSIESVFYAWEMEFDTEMVLSHLIKNAKINLYLANFLLGGLPLGQNKDKIRDEIVAILRKEIVIGEVTKENLAECVKSIGEKVKLRK